MKLEKTVTDVGKKNPKNLHHNNEHWNTKVRRTKIVIKVKKKIK